MLRSNSKQQKLSQQVINHLGLEKERDRLQKILVTLPEERKAGCQIQLDHTIQLINSFKKMSEEMLAKWLRKPEKSIIDISKMGHTGHTSTIFNILSEAYVKKNPFINRYNGTMKIGSCSFFVEGKTGVIFNKQSISKKDICENILESILTASAYLYADNQSAEKIPQTLSISAGLSLATQVGLVVNINNFQDIYKKIRQRLKDNNIVFDGHIGFEGNWNDDKTENAIKQIKDAIFTEFGCDVSTDSVKTYDHELNAEIFLNELGNPRMDFMMLNASQNPAILNDVNTYLETNYPFLPKVQSLPCSKQEGQTCCDHAGYNLFVYSTFGKVPSINEKGTVTSHDLRSLALSDYNLNDPEYVRTIEPFLEPYVITPEKLKALNLRFSAEILKPLMDERDRLQKSKDNCDDKIKAFSETISDLENALNKYEQVHNKKVLRDTIISHLTNLKNNPVIEKHKPYQKLLLGLVNAVLLIMTGILPGAIKYAKTGCLFFSIDGQSKHTVKNTLNNAVKKDCFIT